jgi:O-antigen/teichoic acid export membrane protein
MVGAAAATSFGISVLYIIGLIQVRSILGYWPYDKRFRKVGFIAIMSLSLAIVSLTINITHSLSRVTLISFIILISIIFLLLIIGVDREDRELLRFIRQRLER